MVNNMQPLPDMFYMFPLRKQYTLIEQSLYLVLMQLLTVSKSQALQILYHLHNHYLQYNDTVINSIKCKHTFNK